MYELLKVFMMNKIFRKGISLVLALGMIFTMIPCAWADDDSSSGAAAPPALFSVYINVDGNKEPTLLKSYTSTEMRLLAKESKANYLNDSSYEKIKANGTIYYTAASNYSYSCGRTVTEYVTMADFVKDLGLTFNDGDYLIMGPDYTVDSKYSDYDKGSSKDNYDYWKNYGWYSYDDLFDDRYYFKDWDESKKCRVPSVISLKSYGGSGWTQETYWDMYAGSSDYLWAYVVNFGQKSTTESTYNRFVYQNTECTIKLSDTAAAQPVVKTLLKNACDEAQSELESTITGTKASEVAEGSLWVTEAQKIALQNAYDTNKAFLNEGESADASEKTNAEVYGAYTALNKALSDFKSAKREGTKTGFAWFDADGYDSAATYTIRTKTQLAELAELVSGTADLGETIAKAYDFEGKTINLAADINLDKNRVVIGDANHPFKGTFNGNGHELTNIRISREGGYAGLFAVNEGVIKNLTLDGTVTSSADASADQASAPVGGIAALNKGSIEGCVNKAAVSAENAAEVGGIAGRNEGSIKDCLNVGDITGCRNTGGIAGYLFGTSTAEAKVQTSLNAGKITASCSSLEENSNAGGVVGGVGADKNVYPVIDSCINSGSVESSGKTVGGVVGGAWIGELTVKSCYNVGNVTTKAEGYEALEEGRADAYNVGAVAGRSKGTVEKCYWLEDTAESGIGHAKSGTTIQSMTSAEMAALADKLGDSFTAVDNGYPALKWQKIYQIGFDLDQKSFIDTHYAGEYLPCVAPSDPRIKGQKFGGWYTSEDYAEAFDFSTLTCENKTVYAKLTETAVMDGSSTTAIDYKGGDDSATDPTDKDDDENIDNTDNTSLFDDVKSSDWFNGSVNYVAEKGLMTGTSARIFSPAASTTRGMLMTILARMSGVDTTGSNPWYQAGLDWAVEKGISDGTNPDKEITREQLAAMLYRYAGSPQTNGDISKFSDAESVSEYAQDAMKWAVEKGIVTGKDNNTLAPAANATRAEMAAMLQRYCEAFGK